MRVVMKQVLRGDLGLRHDHIISLAVIFTV